MNIFASYYCPVKSALVLDDLRVNKMIVESAQMLSTALFHHGVDVRSEGLYKNCYDNHPCNIWVRKSSNNFNWLGCHGVSLCNIYNETSGKIHKTQEVIEKALSLQKYIPEGSLTDFANCTPFKNKNDDRTVHEKYRQTLINKWRVDKKTPTWRGRNKPTFYRGL